MNINYVLRIYLTAVYNDNDKTIPQNYKLNAYF